MGYATTCLEDEWSLFNNTAGLAATEQVTIAGTYDAMPSFRPFDRQAFVVAVPTTLGVLATGGYRFGDAVYSEHVAAAGLANTFGIASLGARAQYIQYSTEAFGTKGFFNASLGGIARLTDKFRIGASITNIFQPELSPAANETLPTTLAVGLAVQPRKDVLVTTEVEKDLDYDATWKAGIEYGIHRSFVARGSVQLYPAAAAAGFGFRRQTFTIDYAYRYQSDIGSRHQATFGYRFKKKTS